MHHLVIPPDTGLYDLLDCVWNQVNFDFFVKLHIGNLDDMVE